MSTEEIFHLDDEVQIATCVEEFQSRGFPLIMSHICFLTWQYTHINGIPGFSQETEKAGRTWARYFFYQVSAIAMQKGNQP